MPVAAQNQPTLEDLLEFAHRLADLSADAIFPHFRKALLVENKAATGSAAAGAADSGATTGAAGSEAAGGAAAAAKPDSNAKTETETDPETTKTGHPACYDPVTIADRAAEQIIRNSLIESFPGHGIIGEEYGNHSGSDRYSWVIDPIDGTRSFIMGYPIWGTLIGLMDDGKTVMGMMNQPFTGELFWSDGRQSFCRHGSNGPAQLMTTRPCASIAQAVFSTTDPFLFAPGYESQCFEALRGKAAMSRFGGDCYGYCMLSAGLIDIILESALKPYDIVALIPIVEQAGGVITSWDGGSAVNGDRVLASGNARLHEEVLRLLAAQAEHNTRGLHASPR